LSLRAMRLQEKELSPVNFDTLKATRFTPGVDLDEGAEALATAQKIRSNRLSNY